MEFAEDWLRAHCLSLGLAASAVGLGYAFYRYRKWVGGCVCRSKAVLTGKTVVITGANSGIGLETALDLARRGARVILACRSVERGEAAAKLVRRRTGHKDVCFVQLDLGSLNSVRTAAKSILQAEQKIDILVNNAGVALACHAKTKDGFEAHFGINHLGHFLFTNLLLPSLKAAPSARIVIVSSSLYRRSLSFDFDKLNSSDPARYNKKVPGLAYSQSKLANILFARSLSRRLLGTGVCTYTLNPGVVLRTGIGRDFYRFYSLFKTALFMVAGVLLLKTPRQGAQTIIHCAVAEELEGVSGCHYIDCQEEPVTAIASDADIAEQLWRLSTKMVGLEE